jgi:hypothetical protein
MVDHQGKLHAFSPLAQLETTLPAPICMTDGKRSILQALRSMRSFKRGIEHHKKFSIELQILDSSRRFSNFKLKPTELCVCPVVNESVSMISPA